MRSRQYDNQKGRVSPVVIGALRTASRSFDNGMEVLEISQSFLLHYKKLVSLERKNSKRTIASMVG